MATHSGILACRIPRTEEPGRLQSMGSQESDMTEHTYTHMTMLHDPQEVESTDAEPRIQENHI